MDLGDLQRQGVAIVARAREQAEAILAQARGERDRIMAGVREQARAEGLAQGREQGVALGRKAGEAHALAERREALARLEQAWTQAIGAFERDRDAMLLQAREDVLTLALLLTHRVVHRAYEVDPELLADQLRAALAGVARPSRVAICVHPDDATLAREALPDLLATLANVRHAEIRKDPALARGSCIVRTSGGGVIDASIHAQLDAIARAILPERAPMLPPRGEARGPADAGSSGDAGAAPGDGGS